MLIIFSSCDTIEPNSNDEPSQESLIDQRFQECYYEDDLALKRSNSVLISVFGKDHFENNFVFEQKESSMNCQVDGVVKQVPFGDRAHCVPNSFDLQYVIRLDDQDVYSFRMEAGRDMKFEPVSTIVMDQLLGYKHLLEGNFTITYSKAREIAKDAGVNLEDSALELVKNETLEGASAYHWEAELEYDHNSVTLLLIDTYSGEVRRETMIIEDGIQ